ncbi:hypothetical protein SCB71_14625 [Herbiconiux sp. KACC 21604]|uniref:hypothetical protein n=1 Tax=unclassified Herbiconiux TaxID=2618217 RepID=UPI0014912969|nr:hypothetical protein [Herbiconiux sp. SALV-R1]QJU54377.1 hypothetical protein HL652_12565 [Herbiconiux sp. SALV-R1]WPO85448.1 hypothetical protein SCB71_14625 [Herbiconiux sp. KACC 21604]
MTVQIQPAKPKDEHNGLADIEDRILANPHQTVTVITTYVVKKITEDVETGERYPVLKAKHIEPVLGDDEASAIELRDAAYKTRTGAEELDLDFEGGDDE